MSSSRVSGVLLPLSFSTGALALSLGLAFAPAGCSSAGPSLKFGEGASSSGSGTSSGSSNASSSGSSNGGGGGASSGNGGTSSGGTSSGAASSSSGGGTVPGKDGGVACTTNTGPISGSVTSNGGSLSRIVFAVVGDTRPANEDDTSNYPTPIITKIFQDIEAQSPHPPMTFGTGDYQFASTGSGNTSPTQVGDFMTARASYTGGFFPAMGNHECGVSGSFTTSDNNVCGPGNPGGVTPNYSNFMSLMLGPINQTNPYYSFTVNAVDNSWTAKFVVTAANAWDTDQQSWLETTMAQTTTYTFVFRHEASDATPPLPTGVAGVDAVLANHPYTLLIVGHAHTYGHYSDAPQTVVLGNGGAPLSSKDYGYGLFSQRCDGAIVADEYDYESGATDSEFHFVITPSGQITN